MTPIYELVGFDSQNDAKRALDEIIAAWEGLL
jgi:hypothetical protein